MCPENDFSSADLVKKPAKKPKTFRVVLRFPGLPKYGKKIVALTDKTYTFVLNKPLVVDEKHFEELTSFENLEAC